MKRSALSAALIAATAGAMSGMWTAQAAGKTFPTVSPSAFGATQHMIVVLRDQQPSLRAGTTARQSAVRTEQAAVLSTLQHSDTRKVSSLSSVNALATTLTTSEAASLRADSRVLAVVPDAAVANPFTATAGAASQTVKTAAAGSSSICPTDPSQTLLEPEALQVTNTDFGPGGGTSAHSLGFTGAGVTVAFMADGVDTTSPDLSRNGSPVVTQLDFSGDGPLPSGPFGAEAEGDASSIAAQGSVVYDLSQFVNPAHPLPAGCNIRVEGVAPGANVYSLKVFADNGPSFTSGFVQAIDWAVAHHVNVLNQSFGAQQWPDTSQDIMRMADDAAVAAGVTVTVSSGDAGINSTQGSPATDPAVIDVGASTTWRGYAQTSYAGYGVNGATSWADNNISSLSSGGFAQGNGRTVDLLAPGDLGWALCSPTNSPECNNDAGNPSSIQLFGGTSQSAPLTAGAAALVIQAYRLGHDGKTPSPATVKQILTSTATDINAPAEQQGAGLLNTLAAVDEAQVVNNGEYNVGGGSSSQNLLTNLSQVNLVGTPNSHQTVPFSIRNLGSSTATVNISTRALGPTVATQQGSFTIDSNTDPTFINWLGVADAYQKFTFSVPTTSDRMLFSADYQAVPGASNNARVRFSLVDPSGVERGYSLPQGVGNYGHVEVANPPAGTWTAFFFTTAGSSGTTSPVKWRATEQNYKSVGTVSQSTLTIAPGALSQFNLTVYLPKTPGDSATSIVLSQGSTANAIAVTMRVKPSLTATGGSWSGTITGGNGRPVNDSQTNTYYLDVPQNVQSIGVGVRLAKANTHDLMFGYLVDPHGQTLSFQSTLFWNGSLNSPGWYYTPVMQMYATNPEAGQWSLVLQTTNPVQGTELSQGFSVNVGFNQVNITSSGIPTGNTYASGSTHHASVQITNNGIAPEWYWADPRTAPQPFLWSQSNNSGKTSFNTLTTLIPTDTSAIAEQATGSSSPVTFDTGPFVGDPDLYAGPNSGGKNTAFLEFGNPGGSSITPGLWFQAAEDVGPYTSGPAPVQTITSLMAIYTQGFDFRNVQSSSGNLWSTFFGSGSFTPVEIDPGNTAAIQLTISGTNSTSSPQTVSGTLYIDTFTFLSNAGTGAPNADQVVGIPYQYTISPAS